MKKKIKLGRYFFDFLAVFIAVIAAFALNNWNDNRRDAIAEEKILIEIKNGLQQDLIDVADNKKSNLTGIKTAVYFKNLIENKEVKLDSFATKYFELTVNNLSIMNVSGYESLKSKGLETIKNDSLRLKIISLYEINYQTTRKYNESSPQTMIYANFYKPIQEILSEDLIFDKNALLTGIRTPLKLSPREKSDFNSHLYRIIAMRYVKILEYDKVTIKINDLLSNINEELGIEKDD